MAEFNNVGLKPKTYAWVCDFREVLEKRLERRVTYSEAITILVGLAAKGKTAERLAQDVAKDYS